MVARSATVAGTKIVIITDAVTKKVVDFESVVTTNDTIPINDLTTINGASLMKKSDGTAVTCTVATNVITVTGAGLTDVPVVGKAIGV